MGPMFSFLPDTGKVLRGAIGDEGVADGTDLKKQREEQVPKGNYECRPPTHS